MTQGSNNYTLCFSDFLKSDLHRKTKYIKPTHKKINNNNKKKNTEGKKMIYLVYHFKNLR